MELKKAFKLSTLFLLATAPAFALAQGASITPCSFCGWTIGAGLGASTFMTDTKSTSSSVGNPGDFNIYVPDLYQPAFDYVGNSITDNANGKVYDYNVMGNLFIGYAHVFSNYMYLGGELGVNIYGGNDTELSHSTNSNTTALNGEFGGEVVYQNQLNSKTKISRDSLEPFFDLKLGWLATPTALVYVRGGINYNTIKVENSAAFQTNGESIYIPYDDSQYITSTATASSNFGSSHKESEIGYRAGIGMEFMVTPELGIGADYVYSFYPNVSTKGSGTGSDVACDAFEGCQVVDSAVSNSAKATVSDQQVTAQLIYHFG